MTRSGPSFVFEVNWKSLDIENPPQRRGVYAVFERNGKCFYVGRSKNIRARIRNNRHPIQITKDINLKQVYKWLELAEGDDEWIEHALICRLRPEWNGGTSWKGGQPGVSGPVCDCNPVSTSDLLAAIGI